MPEERDDLDELIERYTADDAELPRMVDALTHARLLVRQLEQRREQRGFTQEEVAGRIGTTQSAIARLECADVDPKLSTVVKYAAVVDCVVELRPHQPTNRSRDVTGK